MDRLERQPDLDFGPPRVVAREARPDEHRSVCDVLGRAFADDPVAEYLFPDPATRDPAVIPAPPAPASVGPGPVTVAIPVPAVDPGAAAPVQRGQALPSQRGATRRSWRSFCRRSR